MNQLPTAFTDQMRELLQEEYPAFLESYQAPRTYGLRVNTLRIRPEEFERISPFALDPIPGLPGCYRIPEDAHPARHPYYAAGLYYLQEPSAMMPAAVLDPQPGEKVLDLCAAPGGKATALAGALAGSGLLVANDVSAARCKVLLRNLELAGAYPVFVTNAQPAALTQRFPEYYDRVMVDAPCSGEGMFRKDETVIAAWSEEKVQDLSALQREIILRAADTLRPGGTMVYSTCTFDPREDECIISHLLSQRPAMRLLRAPDLPGAARGFSGSFLASRGFPADSGHPLENCVRFWPHKTGGEGHFLALLGKVEGGENEKPDSERPASEKPGSGKPDGKKTDGGKPDGKRPGSKKPDMRRAERRKDARRPGQRESADAAACGRELVETFLTKCGIEAPDQMLSLIEIRGDKVYASAPLPPLEGGLPFLRNGLWMGDLKKDRFEPAQPLAMVLSAQQCKSALSFPADDERIVRYLRGETLVLDEADEGLFASAPFSPGWKLVCINGYALGWAKLSGMLLKNHYQSAWRSDGYVLRRQGERC